MGNATENHEEVAEAFRRLAVKFGDAGRQWANDRRRETQQIEHDTDDEEKDPDVRWAKFMEGLSPRCRATIERSQEEMRQQDLLDQDRRIFTACRELACRAGRLSIEILDHLKPRERLRVEAFAINANDDDAVCRFWWDEIAPVVLGQGKKCEEERPVPFIERFQQGAEACEAIANMFSSEQLQVTHLDLSVKGLVEAGLGSRTSILKAADAAGVERAKHGQHGFKFSAADVYRIGLERGDPSKSRLSKDQRSKWNDFLVKIGQPTLDMPRKATKKAPG